MKLKSVKGHKCCCCCGNSGSGPTCVCLIFLLYDDGVYAYWTASIYSDGACTTAVETEVWTLSGYSAPQHCNEEPYCLQMESHPLVADPVLQGPLPKGQSYVDILETAVGYPGLPEDQTWDPKDALRDLGELKTTFVKVKNAAGKYFAVRLSVGIAELAKIQYPRGAFPRRPQIIDRKIVVGFETEMDAADVKKLDEAIPKVWKRYPESATAYILSVGGVDYNVTTTAANAIKLAKPKMNNAARS